MAWPDGRSLTFHGGVFPEPATPDGRLVLWLAGKPNGVEALLGARREHPPRACHPRSEGSVSRGRPRLRLDRSGAIPSAGSSGGSGGRLRRGPGPSPTARRSSSAVPAAPTSGSPGPRMKRKPLDETRVRELWPHCEKVRALGPNLFLVYGVRPDPPASHNGTPSDAPAAESPVHQAELALNHARSSSDAHRLVTALADLGLAHLKDGNFPRAREVLEEAVAAARRLGDPAREVDASCAPRPDPDRPRSARCGTPGALPGPDTRPLHRRPVRREGGDGAPRPCPGCSFRSRRSPGNLRAGPGHRGRTPRPPACGRPALARRHPARRAWQP